MKIAYLVNLNDRSHEGRVIMFKRIMEHFSKNHEVSVNDPEKAMGADIINIHSSGFLESFDLEKYPGKKVYSLHANINPIRFKWVRYIAKRSLF